jgi:hypothetical protein
MIKENGGLYSTRMGNGERDERFEREANPKLLSPRE